MFWTNTKYSHSLQSMKMKKPIINNNNNWVVTWWCKILLQQAPPGYWTQNYLISAPEAGVPTDALQNHPFLFSTSRVRPKLHEIQFNKMLKRESNSKTDLNNLNRFLLALLADLKLTGWSAEMYVRKADWCVLYHTRSLYSLSLKTNKTEQYEPVICLCCDTFLSTNF